MLWHSWFRRYIICVICVANQSKFFSFQTSEYLSASQEQSSTPVVIKLANCVIDNTITIGMVMAWMVIEFNMCESFVIWVRQCFYDWHLSYSVHWLTWHCSHYVMLRGEKKGKWCRIFPHDADQYFWFWNRAVSNFHTQSNISSKKM